MAARIGVGDKGKESSQPGVKERSNGEKISIFYEGDTTHTGARTLSVLLARNETEVAAMRFLG